MNKKWFLFGIMLIGLTLFSGCGKQKIENNTEAPITHNAGIPKEGAYAKICEIKIKENTEVKPVVNTADTIKSHRK